MDPRTKLFYAGGEKVSPMDFKLVAERPVFIDFSLPYIPHVCIFPGLLVLLGSFSLMARGT